MSTLWDVVGVGENSVDRVLRMAGAIPLGGSGKHQVDVQGRTLGGQVVTTLCTCAALGLRASYVGAFGDDDDGTFARRGLQEHGVDVASASTRPAPNRQAVVLVDARGERVVLWSRDAALRVTPADVPPEVIRASRLLHVDGVDTDAACFAAGIARDAGRFVTCDIDTVGPGTERLVALASHPILAERVPMELTGETTPRRALLALGRTHEGPVCVTRGPAGASWVLGDQVVDVPAFRVSAVDTTGAGDVFRGAFIAALLDGQSPNAIMRFAAAAAALACTRIGAVGGVPSRAAIDALLLQD